MTTYYISSAATNGYVVGDNSNDGLAKSTPWRDLDSVASAAAVTDGDTVYINGDMACDGEWTLGDTVTWIGEAGTRPVLTVRNGTAGSYGARLATSGKTVTMQHLEFNEGLSTSSLFNISPVALATLVLDDCKTVGNQYHVFCPTSGRVCGLTVTNCEAYSTALANLVYNGPTLGDASAISISGLKLDITSASTSSKAVLSFVANAGTSCTCAIAGVTGTVNAATMGAGDTASGIYIKHFDAAVIENCNISIAVGTGAACNFYKITSTEAGLVLTSGYIRNNRGRTNAVGGILITAGEDGGAYNGADAIQIYGNHMTGGPGDTTLHGVTFGGNISGHAYNNRVQNVYIGTLAKSASNIVFSHNVIERVDPDGQALRAKGATDCTWSGNLHIVEGAYNGETIQLTLDDAGPTNSTGCVFDGNMIYAFYTATAQTTVVELQASQTATFKGNVYYDAKGLPATGFLDGATAESLADWNAESFVTGDVSFAFVPRQRVNIDKRLLSPVRGL